MHALKKKDDKTGLRHRAPLLENAFREVADAYQNSATKFDFFGALESSTKEWNRQKCETMCQLLFGFHYGIVKLWKAFGVQPNQSTNERSLS